VKLTVDTAVSDLTTTKYWYGLSHKFEGHRLYTTAKQGKVVTLSFLFKSNVTGKFSVSMRNLTDMRTNIDSYVTSFDYTVSGVVQKVEIQIPLNHAFNPALQNNSNMGFNIAIGFLNQESFATSTTEQWQTGNYLCTPDCVNWGATAGNYFEIAELQLEEGEVATAFERVPYDIQLQRCMRYYRKTKDWVLLSSIANDVGRVHNAYLSPLMRTTPSYLEIATSGCSVSNTNMSYTAEDHLDIRYKASSDTTSAFVKYELDAEL